MDDTTFLNSFRLRTYTYKKFHHNDASAGNHCHYLGLMIEGSGTLVGRDTRIQVEKGDLFYIPKGYKYHSYWSGTETVSFYSMGFVYSPCTVEYRLQKIQRIPEAETVLQELLADYQTDILAIGRLYTLLGLLLPDMERIGTSKQSQIVERAMEHMRQHPCAKIPDVAEICGVSESTLYLTFQKSLRKTPNDVRQELRCEKAALLLATTDLSVEEISRSLSFSSSSYFRKVFREVTGKAPREYRKKETM